MDYKELIDPELRKSANSFPFNSGIVMVGNLYQDFEWGRTKGPEGMEEKEIVIEGTQNLQVKTTVFSMADEQADMPALVYVHGGAFAYKAAAYQKKLAMIYAKKAGCKVFFPHYHLAPKYQYPAASCTRLYFHILSLNILLGFLHDPLHGLNTSKMILF